MGKIHHLAEALQENRTRLFLAWQNTGHLVDKGERHCISAVAFMVAGGGFEPPTFGLCDLTHLSMRVGLYLHPRGVLAIQSLRLPPPFRGLGSVLPYRSRDVGSTDFDE
jgi:hypothetical protein